jgi:hypothetical protein
MNKGKKKATGNFYFLIFAVVGILLFAFMLIQLINNVNFRKNAIETTATISRITSSSDDTDHTAYIEYQVNGRTYNDRLSYYSSGLYEGKKIKIYYDPDNPSQIVDGTLLNDIWPLLLALVFILVGVVPTVTTYKKNRLHNYLLANGRKIKATFTEIKVTEVVKDVHDGLIVVEKENPLPMLVFEYFDSSRNRFTFKIDYSSHDTGSLGSLIGKEVDIYTDPNDFSSYYVDIDSLFEAATN